MGKPLCAQGSGASCLCIWYGCIEWIGCVLLLIISVLTALVRHMCGAAWGRGALLSQQPAVWGCVQKRLCCIVCVHAVSMTAVAVGTCWTRTKHWLVVSVCVE